jgi:osmotically-inducible protein OsmY
MRRLSILVVLLLLAFTSGCAGVVVAGAAAGGLAAHDRRSLGSQLDDATIETKAHAAIATDSELSDSTHVNVTSVNGIVLLSGETETAEARDRVLGTVRDIQSIRRITNEVRVAPPSSFSDRSADTWLTTKVKTKLMFTGKVDATRIKVITENRAVYLMGLVTQQEADIATEAARTVAGVERVVKLFEYLD